MTSRTALSTFVTRTGVLLQGVPVADVSTADRKIAIRHAVQEYNQYFPKRAVTEFAGDGGSYYLLNGRIISVANSVRDAAIDFRGSTGDPGTDEQLSIEFTLSYPRDIQQIDLWLMRIGATVAGTVQVDLYTATGAGLPDQPIASSQTIEIDGVDGCRRGIFKWVEFHFDPTVQELPAGDYCAVLVEDTGYTYVSTSNEVNMGVDQSSVTNNLGTYDGSTWAAFGTDSEGIIRVLGCIPGWLSGLARIQEIEYPAAAISSDQQPTLLEAEDYRIYTTEDGTWLYFPNLGPPSSTNIRVRFAKPYIWVEATDPMIDTPSMHFEALCNLSAANCCEWLAARYGQNSDASFVADVVDTQEQDMDYRQQAKIYRERYEVLTGLNKLATAPAFGVVDVDLRGSSKADFVFHGSRTR